MADVNNMTDGASESGGLSFMLPDSGNAPIPADQASGDVGAVVMAGSDSNNGGAQIGMNASQGLQTVFDDGIVPLPADGHENALGLPEDSPV